MNLVAIVGLITVLMAGSIALVMTDLKRILAYSTISHLGFMMLALGCGGFSAAIFHLIVHAFAKAMLFLSAGSISHATGTLDIREMGGLAKKLPLTTFCFTIGALALAGLPPLSGFFSKDEVLLAIMHGRSPIFLLLALVGVFLSALYMGRALFLVFLGPLPSNRVNTHESPPLMLIPMLIFAVITITLGLVALPLTGSYEGIGAVIHLDAPFGKPHPFEFNIGLAVVSLSIAMIAFFVTWLFYIKHRFNSEKLISLTPSIHRLLTRKYYIDEVYEWVINRIVLVSARIVATFDRIVINELGVHGTGKSILWSGERLRYHVTGRIYNYALGMVSGALILIILWWVF